MTNHPNRCTARLGGTQGRRRQMTDYKWQIHYTGSPHADSSYGDLIAKGFGVAALDAAWAANGCRNRALDYTVYVATKDGRLTALSDWEG